MGAAAGPASRDEGREFTVGLVGNDEPTLLPIVETVFPHPRGVNLFDPDPPLLAMVAGRFSSASLMRPVHRTVCPARLDEDLAERVRHTARRAFRALGCRDWCRIDMRLASEGRLHVIELNPIAGLAHPTSCRERQRRPDGPTRG